MNWSKWIRQIPLSGHRLFTVTVIGNFTGLYLFVLPYATTRRSGRRAD